MTSTPSLAFETVVEQIQMREETFRDAAARLHHCVRVGWVKPIGKAPGTGRKRRYPVDTPLRVVMLQGARSVGLTAKEADYVLRSKDLAPFLDPTRKPATDKTLLVVSTSSDLKAKPVALPDIRICSPAQLAAWIAKSDPEIFIHDTFQIVDVGKIRERFEVQSGEENK
jgi:hypothetical protein